MLQPGLIARLIPSPSTSTKPGSPIVTATRDSRRHARTAVGCGLLVFFLLNVALGLTLDFGSPRWRDPEFGKRLSRLLAKIDEHPNRPTVLVIGSSRAAMGVHPGSVEELGQTDGSSPMLFNMSLAGAGPVMELMVLQRLLAVGVKPDLVLFEYWPAFLREDGPYNEQVRIDPQRLRPEDRPLVRDYFDDPAETLRQMVRLRICPVYSHRKSAINQIAPSFHPNAWRNDSMFEKLDEWGWLPGRVGATEEARAGAKVAVGHYYIPLFAAYQVSPKADRALRESIELCEKHGIAYGWVYLPEASHFREYMTPEAVRWSEEHLRTTVAELGFPLIDARDWVDDYELPDGFHLTQAGAVEFTRELYDRLPHTFPNLFQGRYPMKTTPAVQGE